MFCLHYAGDNYGVLGANHRRCTSEKLALTAVVSDPALAEGSTYYTYS
jgi:hypothetical protein